MEEIRLNKYLSEAGVCSRREADKRIAEGRVTVDGKPALTGMKITPDRVICVDGVRVGRLPEPVLIAVYKPAGVVCTAAESEKKNLVTYVGYPERLFPVGRLDKDSEGLILMTNQGELADRIAHARGLHEKEYIVRIDRPVTQEFVEAMSRGVKILNTRTRPCQVEKIASNRFRIILTQGLNRQIRRMCEALGCRVTQLCRVRVMNITLGDLRIGEYRHIAGDELEALKSLL